MASILTHGSVWFSTNNLFRSHEGFKLTISPRNNDEDSTTCNNLDTGAKEKLEYNTAGSRMGDAG